MNFSTFRLCHEWMEPLMALRAEDLAPAESRVLLAHLSSCARCAAVFAGYRQTDRVLRTLPQVEIEPEERNRPALPPFHLLTCSEDKEAVTAEEEQSLRDWITEGFEEEDNKHPSKWQSNGATSLGDATSEKGAEGQEGREQEDLQARYQQAYADYQEMLRVLLMIMASIERPIAGGKEEHPHSAVYEQAEEVLMRAVGALPFRDTYEPKEEVVDEDSTVPLIVFTGVM